ncbi:MAG: hypothetical protein OSB09_09020 [Planctomycetota bacterium]|nr:hypothetical protein [Planctomycetota bacterium]
MMRRPLKRMEIPRNPRFPGVPIFESMTTTKLLFGVVVFCVLVTAVAAAAVGDGDQILRFSRPSLSVPPTVAASMERQSPAAPTPKESSGDAVIEFLTSRYQGAILSFENGNFEKAWRVCEAILVLAPDQFPLRLDVKKLRRRAHGRHLSRSVFVVRFELDEADETRAFPLSFLEGSVVLENLTQEKILFGDHEQNPVLGQVKWTVNEVYENGTIRSLSDVRVLRIESGFRVEAGASRAIPVTLPMPVPSSMPVLQQWAVTGVTMPVRLVTAEGEVSRGIPWLEETGLVVPEQYRSIEQNPKSEVRKALLDGNPVRMAIAQYLWLAERSDSRRSPNPSDPIVDEFLATLGAHHGVLDLLIVKSLEEVTGLIRERSARAWKIWGVTRQVRRGTGQAKDRLRGN